MKTWKYFSSSFRSLINIHSGSLPRVQRLIMLAKMRERLIASLQKALALVGRGEQLNRWISSHPQPCACDTNALGKGKDPRWRKNEKWKWSSNISHFYALAANLPWFATCLLIFNCANNGMKLCNWAAFISNSGSWTFTVLHPHALLAKFQAHTYLSKVVFGICGAGTYFY